MRDFETWFEDNEGDLRGDYIEYLRDKKRDNLEDKVFWFEEVWRPEEAVNSYRRARDAWEEWLNARYEAYCSDAPDDARGER